jgi:hypothetical protein
MLFNAGPGVLVCTSGACLSLLALRSGAIATAFVRYRNQLAMARIRIPLCILFPNSIRVLIYFQL